MDASKGLRPSIKRIAPHLMGANAKRTKNAAKGGGGGSDDDPDNKSCLTVPEGRRQHEGSDFDYQSGTLLMFDGKLHCVHQSDEVGYSLINTDGVQVRLHN